METRDLGNPGAEVTSHRRAQAARPPIYQQTLSASVTVEYSVR
jgi:hypothetical protein